MEKLMGCPFCGNDKELRMLETLSDGHYVQCMCCFSRSGWYAIKSHAVENWNNRPPNTQIQTNAYCRIHGTKLRQNDGTYQICPGCIATHR